jgi:sugar phosphate isomerase/epimerase
MVYVIPTFQNPTGKTLPEERRKALAELGSKYDVIILEDDPYQELRYSGDKLKPIKYYDQTGHTVYANSFSKIFSPGSRLGFVYAAPEIIDKLFDIKVATNSHTSNLPQVLCAEFFNRGYFDAHLEKARRTFWLANRLGCPYIRMFSFYPPKGKNIRDCREEVIEKVGALLDLADEYGVTLCHENEAKIYGEAPELCLDLLQHFDGRLRCVFDMGNYVLEGVKPLDEGYGLLKDTIAYFHIKDALSAGAIVPPGCGEANIKEILSEHVRYSADDFFVSVEPHLQLFSGLNALVGRRFDNPYKYNDPKEAFTDAVNKLKELLPRGKLLKRIF